MRQFILASDFTGLSEEVTLDSLAAGILTLAGTAKKDANLVLRRSNADGGNILFPIYPKDFTYVKATYTAGVTFTATFTVPTITPYLDYTVTFVKKGKKFNERSNWSACVHAGGADTADTVATKIAKYVNDNAVTLGLTATVAGAAVTVTAAKAGEDYTVTFGDEMYGTALTSVTQGKPAFMDAEMIKDLFNKAAADRGFEYTYDEFDIYPGYDFNPLKQADAVDVGFDVYTLRFTEPRLMGTREEAVYQIIQVAFPTGGGGTFAAALDEFLGIAAPAEDDEVSES